MWLYDGGLKPKGIAVKVCILLPKIYKIISASKESNVDSDKKSVGRPKTFNKRDL